tara:strand:+ start:1282 stop:1476 length:195 start_codon:yes stop_codon:yes gene_type:complete
MIDEDRTFENEVRFNNDRLGVKKNREDNKGNIPLDLESSNTPKIQKEKVNGVCSDDNHLCVCGS